MQIENGPNFWWFKKICKIVKFFRIAGMMGQINTYVPKFVGYQFLHIWLNFNSNQLSL